MHELVTCHSSLVTRHWLHDVLRAAPTFELDPIGECYFAALVYGLSLIAEKEADLGLERGSADLDGAALVDFVRRKGDRLVHLMSTENRVRGPYIRWTEEEMQAVASELVRQFPEVSKFGPEHFQRAQSILPSARRRTNWNYGITTKLRALATSKPGLQLAIARNGSSKVTTVPSVALVADASFDAIAQQLVGTLVEMKHQGPHGRDRAAPQSLTFRPFFFLHPSAFRLLTPSRCHDAERPQ